MSIYRKSLIGMVAAASLIVSTVGFAKKPEDQTTIVDVAAAINAETEEFSILLLAAGLYPDIVAYLDGRGQRTLFAPTDEAFGRLNDILPLFCYADVLELQALQPDYVADVLTYHAAKGRKDAAEVLPLDEIRMLSGDFVTRTPGSLVITDAIGRDANLLAVDVPADNGIIHVISEVILPYPPQSNCP